MGLWVLALLGCQAEGELGPSAARVAALEAEVTALQATVAAHEETLAAQAELLAAHADAIAAADLDGVATEAWVEANYATPGDIDAALPDGALATEASVAAALDAALPEGDLATEPWVAAHYATPAAVDAALAAALPQGDLATEAWVTDLLVPLPSAGYGLDLVGGAYELDPAVVEGLARGVAFHTETQLRDALDDVYLADAGGLAVDLALGASDLGCDDTHLGALEYRDGAFYGCSSSGWAFLGGLGLGTAPTRPARSCLDVLHADWTAASGPYWIVTDGAPFQVYCDMETDGGGWTLVSEAWPVAEPTANLCTPDAVGAFSFDDLEIHGPAKLSNADIDAIWSEEKELLVRNDEQNLTGLSIQWDRACIADFVSGYEWHTSVGAGNDLAQLDSTSVRCLTGALDDGVLDAPFNSGNHCGYSFTDGSMHLLYGATTGYGGGTCTGAVSGRSWLGPANNGCNTSRAFVR